MRIAQVIPENYIGVVDIVDPICQAAPNGEGPGIVTEIVTTSEEHKIIVIVFPAEIKLGIAVAPLRQDIVDGEQDAVQSGFRRAPVGESEPEFPRQVV